jgi:hypothetical protein
MRISKGLKQAYDLMDFTYAATVALRDACGSGKRGKLTISREDASAIAALVKAWELTADRVRVLRGKPLPGALRPDKPTPRRKRPSVAPVGDPGPAPAPPPPTA